MKGPLEWTDIVRERKRLRLCICETLWDCRVKDLLQSSLSTFCSAQNILLTYKPPTPLCVRRSSTSPLTRSDNAKRWLRMASVESLCSSAEAP